MLQRALREDGFVSRAGLLLVGDLHSHPPPPARAAERRAALRHAAAALLFGSVLPAAPPPRAAFRAAPAGRRRAGVCALRLAGEVGPAVYLPAAHILNTSLQVSRSPRGILRPDWGCSLAADGAAARLLGGPPALASGAPPRGTRAGHLGLRAGPPEHGERRRAASARPLLRTYALPLSSPSPSPARSGSHNGLKTLFIPLTDPA